MPRYRRRHRRPGARTERDPRWRGGRCGLPLWRFDPTEETKGRPATPCVPRHPAPGSQGALHVVPCETLHFASVHQNLGDLGSGHVFLIAVVVLDLVVPAVPSRDVAVEGAAHREVLPHLATNEPLAPTACCRLLSLRLLGYLGAGFLLRGLGSRSGLPTALPGGPLHGCSFAPRVPRLGCWLAGGLPVPHGEVPRPAHDLILRRLLMVATIEEDLEGFRDAVEQHDLSVLVLVAQPPSPHLRADADPEVLTLPVLVLVDQGLARIGEQGHEVLRGHFLLRLVGEGDDVAPVKIRRLTGVRALPNDAADDKLGWTRELHHVMPDGDQRFPVDGEALREGEGAVVGRHQGSRLPLEETLEVLVVEGIRSGWFRTGRVPPTNHFP
eukprot:scaffold536_cov250-Pinguiococcus_pyrenoidosus.AAC.6